MEQAPSLPSQKPQREWRTRQDPLEQVWESEVVPLLQADPAFSGVTLLEELQRRHPGDYDGTVLRTLQRRVRQWRALHGAEREVYFAQEHPPGWLGLSDFTVCDGLGVQIGGTDFGHRLYQFALAHSGWRHAVVCVGGESFMVLSTGLQAALWRLGGVPEEHRTDSLSAAFNNLAEQAELTQRYEALCGHYGMRGSRCNPGQSHENGSIESRHASLKTALDQALRLRGSRTFEAVGDYEQFVDSVVQRMNARVGQRLQAERAMLRALPARRTAEFEELPARVSKFAVFTVKGAQYSAPSQLIGHRLMVRVYSQHIECWLGGQRVLERTRATHADGCRHPRNIDHRDLVAALKRKPGAFARWCCAMQSSRARSIGAHGSGWRRPGRNAKPARRWWGCCHWPPTDTCATGRLDQLPDLQALAALLAPPKGEVPDVAVQLPPLHGYDALLQAGGARHAEVMA